MNCLDKVEQRRTVYRTLIRRAFGKKPAGRPRSRGKDYFTTDKITEIVCGDDRWEELTPYYVSFAFNVRRFEFELCIV
jgi:hypothetical protein